ncbi:MAG: LCP family protein, partial [Gaiellales bacterium]
SWDDADLDGPRGPRAPRRMLRFVRRGIFVLLALGAVVATLAFVSFRSAVNERNNAVPEKVRAALAPANGPALAASHVTLLVGADTSGHRRRKGEAQGGLSDTLLLMRVHVPSRTVSMLSIPRDLYVEIPGYGSEKINEAYALGGLALAIKTVRRTTGVEINHVAQIDFDGFKEVVDALGGVTIDNPTAIRSGTPFDGKMWSFRKGKQTLTGRQALAYARMRKVDNATLARDPAEGTDLGRARRQQRIVDAIVSDVVSLDSVRHPRDIPEAVVKPLLTDISAFQMLSFGFGKWWSKPDNNLRCRLGGDQSMSATGEDILIPDAENRAAVRMFLGKQAPIPPQNALSAGCVREADR